MKKPVALQFYGEIQEGMINCNLPLTRISQNVISFTSLAGASKWMIMLEKGILDVQLPKPGH